jgi:3-oxoacyl-[acyl-carrier protein] reductase
MNTGLDRRVALVTGASKGIGRAIAQGLAEEGASLIICGRRDAELQLAADELRETGSKVLASALDITLADSVPKLVEAGNSEFGRIDVLVNNVGGTPPAKLEELSDTDWHVGFETNFFTAVRLTSACAPDMAARGWGRIINIASINARQPDVYFAVYSAAKAALLNFTGTLSSFYAKSGVLSTCVIPGITRSEMVDSNIKSAANASGKSFDEIVSTMLKRVPTAMDRLGEAHEIAAAVVFLASDLASWITGTSLTVDGGTIPVIP